MALRSKRGVGPILHKALFAQKDRPIPSKNVRRLRRVFSGGEGAIACGIIAPRRSNSAHLHRPWRAISDQLRRTRRPDDEQAA
jgi:hypothetical protein